MLYVIDQSETDSLHAGSKAREDATAILLNAGAAPIGLSCSFDNTPKAIISDTVSMHRQVIRAISSLKRGDIVLLQFPYRCFTTLTGKSIAKIARRNGIKIVALVHDLDSLRRENALERIGEFSIVEKMHSDIGFLKEMDCVISHNKIMTQYLVDMGFDPDRIVDLGLFDYLCPPIERSCSNIPTSVSYAGNLAQKKSGFLYGSSFDNCCHCVIELFGNGYTGPSGPPFCAHGAVDPALLPSALPDGFGLVWDGPTGESCTGVYGDYLRFNNPHKLSLYYASGLVPIVWRKSAAASFVESTESGFCIDSLSQLGSLVSECNLDDYRKRKRNAEMIQMRVSSGSYLSSAVDRAIQMLR